MVGILVSLWDFEWILPIFRGELLVSREKNRIHFHRGSIHPLIAGCWDGQSMTRNEQGHQVSFLVGVVVLVVILLNDLLKGESCYLLNAFMKLVFCLFTPWYCTRESARVFFTPSMITCWSSKVRYVSLENDFVVDEILSKNKLLSFPFGLLLSLDMFLRKKSCSNILG